MLAPRSVPGRVLPLVRSKVWNGGPDRVRSVKSTRRAAASLLSVLVLTVSAVAPALAITKPDDGDEPGNPLSLFQALGFFVGIPLLVIGALVFLIYVPSLRSPKTPFEPSTEVARRTNSTDLTR